MKYILLISFITIIACQPSTNRKIDSGSSYLPDLDKLSTGLVWKYYVHYIDKKTKTTTTNIYYIKYELKSNNNIEIEYYNAGFQKKHFINILIADNLWKTEKQYDILNNGDTTNYQIYENILKNWDTSEAFQKRSKEMVEMKMNISDHQISLYDSIHKNINLKVFKSTKNIEIISPKETTKRSRTSIQTWQKGLGMTSQISQSKDIIENWELVELMTSNEFSNRANHNTHRVGYIDPNNALDNQKEFKTCDKIENIADYYNADIAQFKGGKGSLKAYLEKHLDKSKLNNESGYLTYRFIINCEGKAGRFITEQANLSFEKKTFNEGCINHFYEILKSVEEWKPLYIKDNSRDAYVYITFKLKNGEIIELLP